MEKKKKTSILIANVLLKKRWCVCVYVLDLCRFATSEHWRKEELLKK